MKLLTQEIRNCIPKLGEQEHLGENAVIYVKFFNPCGAGTWYATEYDGEDTFFGLVEGHEKELGYFSLSELAKIRGPLGLPIERDLHFKPRTLSEIAPEKFKEDNCGGAS